MYLSLDNFAEEGFTVQFSACLASAVGLPGIVSSFNSP